MHFQVSRKSNYPGLAALPFGTARFLACVCPLRCPAMPESGTSSSSSSLELGSIIFWLLSDRWCWTIHDYWFVCRLQTWMNMFLCGSSMRKSQIKDLWQNRVTLKLEFAIQIMQIKVLGTESKCIHWCIDTCFWFRSPKIKYFFWLSKSNFTSIPRRFASFFKLNT